MKTLSVHITVLTVNFILKKTHAVSLTFSQLPQYKNAYITANRQNEQNVGNHFLRTQGSHFILIR